MGLPLLPARTRHDGPSDPVHLGQVLEADVADCEKKCKQVNCGAIYDAIIASFRLLYDLVFLCFNKKKT